MRVVGMDIHRAFAQVAILEDGEIKQPLRVDLVHHRVVEFARTLGLENEVVIEANGNSAAVERLIRPHVKRVAIANPRLVLAIAYARGHMPNSLARRRVASATVIFSTSTDSGVHLPVVARPTRR